MATIPSVSTGNRSDEEEPSPEVEEAYPSKEHINWSDDLSDETDSDSTIEESVDPVATGEKQNQGPML